MRSCRRPYSLRISAYENEKELARERAIIPYIKKARATYPVIKKRFLAGLPPGHVFAVMIRLQHIDKAKKEITVNDAFVRVDTIKNGKVYGRLDPVFTVGYKEGDLISFPESEIINWAIQRPDGGGRRQLCRKVHGPLQAEIGLTGR